MASTQHFELIGRKYREVFGASAWPCFTDWIRAEGVPCAALGYRRASSGSLFLEAYLERPVDEVVSAALGRPVARDAIVEIGNFAADNAIAMVELWGRAANDLGGNGEIAVATLTAPLRRMFARIGLPIMPVAKADPARLENASAEWGSYYATDPLVCIGVIADGQAAISAFLARRNRKAAA